MEGSQPEVLADFYFQGQQLSEECPNYLTSVQKYLYSALKLVCITTLLFVGSMGHNALNVSGPLFAILKRITPHYINVNF